VVQPLGQAVPITSGKHELLVPALQQIWTGRRVAAKDWCAAGKCFEKNETEALRDRREHQEIGQVHQLDQLG
jgi:hypothetical protein